MSLSLVELCMVSLRNSIEEGRHLPIHALPIRMRQPLLDFILMHGTVENRNCVRSLGSIEFLQGMTTVDTREGSTIDSEYLHRVADVMGSIVDGELMGDKVTSLKLNVYIKFSSYNFQSLCESNILDVTRLISKCRNLETLDLRLAGVKVDGAPRQAQRVPVSPFLIDFIEQRCGVLDEDGPFHMCISVLEMVKEFSFVVLTSSGYWHFRFKLMKPGNNTIQFNRLIALCLSSVNVDITNWSAFLNSSRESLTTLHLCDVLVSGPSGAEYSLLPFLLPRLQEVSIREENKGRLIEGEPLIGEVLSQCPELEHVDLCLWLVDRVNVRVMKSLTKLPAIRNVEIYLQPFAGDILGWMLDNGFNEKITSIMLGCSSLYHQNIAMLDHVIDICQNLTEFGLDVFVQSGLQVPVANASRLFANMERERAVQLRKLSLKGKIRSQFLGGVENRHTPNKIYHTKCKSLVGFTDPPSLSVAQKTITVFQISRTACSIAYTHVVC